MFKFDRSMDNIGYLEERPFRSNLYVKVYIQIVKFN
jgi:hypothetical protein